MRITCHCYRRYKTRSAYDLLRHSTDTAMSYCTMYALAIVALFLVTPSTASPSIIGRDTSACTIHGTPNQNNFTLWATSDSDIDTLRPLALGDQSYTTGWIGVFSLPLFAKIVLIRHVFCSLQMIWPMTSQATSIWPTAGSPRSQHQQDNISLAVLD
jgi:hypothetical protein